MKWANVVKVVKVIRGELSRGNCIAPLNEFSSFKVKNILLIKSLDSSSCSTFIRLKVETENGVNCLNNIPSFCQFEEVDFFQLSSCSVF